MGRRIVFLEILMRNVFYVLILSALATSLHAQLKPVGLNAPGLFEQGMNLLQGGQDTQRDVDAIDDFRRSAELGYAPAQVVLGYFYDTGKVLTQEPGQALYWYKRAAAQNDPLAQRLVGEVVLSGRTGPVDRNEAGAWLTKSASQGDPFAAYLLGRIFLDRQDYATAARWFRPAAMAGLPQAQRQLALLLKDGRGVQQDRVEAYVWLLVAADVLHNSGSEELSEVETALDSYQISAAKLKARALAQRTSRAVTAHGCTGWEGEFDTMPAPPPPFLQQMCRAQ
jgi:TPR repeat protein